MDRGYNENHPFRWYIIRFLALRLFAQGELAEAESLATLYVRETPGRESTSLAETTGLLAAIVSRRGLDPDRAHELWLEAERRWEEAGNEQKARQARERATEAIATR